MRVMYLAIFSKQAIKRTMDKLLRAALLDKWTAVYFSSSFFPIVIESRCSRFGRHNCSLETSGTASESLRAAGLGVKLICFEAMFMPRREVCQGAKKLVLLDLQWGCGQGLYM